jgi:predicted nucleic acid-binding protein
MSKDTKIERYVSAEELKEYYGDIAELATIFNHDIIETDAHIWRFKHNALMSAMVEEDGFRVSLNDVWVKYARKRFTKEELMKFYMQIGYSLCGFNDIFDSNEIAEMIKKHKGEVLKL